MNNLQDLYLDWSKINEWTCSMHKNNEEHIHFIAKKYEISKLHI